ncbi:hypothetical protein SGLAM104S_01112 [Streptomyces glaucescens]
MARSAAEMPVVTPCAPEASTETVNAVFIDSVLSATICGSWSRSSSSPSMGAQIRPRHSLIMNATISGGGLLCGDDEVALVLPVLVVDDHDRAAGRDVGDGLFDRVEGEVLDAVGAVEQGGRGHAGAPSRTGCPDRRERSHQSRRPHRTSAP